MELAQKAVDAGIPLAPHMLTENKFARLAGEAAEKVPYAGGKGKQRQAAFNAGLAKAIDPETAATKLTPDVFAELQDKAGQAIGDISARTPVPKDALGDLTSVARRETPDVQAVVKAYADDFAKVADENGGVIPGDTLRRLRTEAQSQARTTSNGDLRRTLGDLVKKVDDALTEHAAEGDMEALLDARRRYAISKTLEPLVAKSANGDISPAALMSRVTADRAGKQRMARGRGGELGDYARIGQQFLKEQATSNTAERNIVYKVFTDAVAAGKAATAYPLAAAYNLLGPKAAKWMVERQRKRGPPTSEAPPPPAEPTLGMGFEPPPTRGGPANPLGDLTPDWETTPGAGGERPPAMSPEGLVQAVGDPAVTTGRRQDLRSPLEIPAVPGRPDLPDALVTGAPAEVAGTPRAISAMDEPGAIEARRQQGMAESEAAAAAQRAEPVPVGEATEIKPEVVTPANAPKDPRLAEIARLKAATKSDVVRKALDRRAAAVKRELDATQAADDLRAAAEQTKDPETKKVLLAEADKMAKPEPIPVGEATEIKPEVIEPGVPREEGQSPAAAIGKADEASVQQAGPDSPATPAANRAQADEGRPGEGEVDGGRLRADDLQPEGRQEGVQADGGTGAQAGKKLTSRQADAEAKRLTDETGVKHVARNVERVDEEGYTVGEWKAVPEDLPENRPGGMSVEEAKAYLERANKERPIGGSWDEIERKQGGKLNRKNLDKGTEHKSLSGFPEIDEGFMREQQRVQEAARPAPVSDRGLAAVRRTLEEGVAAGKLDKDGVSLALWALDRNPNLAKGLQYTGENAHKSQPGLKIETSATAANPGSYNSSMQVVRLLEDYKGAKTSALSTAHEILHHAERMMPENVQIGIRREWRRAVEKAIKNTSPLEAERRDALQLALRAMGDGDATAVEAMKPYFASGVLNRDADYRLVNPTEWWAENASEVLHGRFKGRGSWRAQAKQWLSEFVERIKSIFGERSHYEVIKALDEILNPTKTTGERKSKNMITGSGRREQPAQPQAP